MTTFKPYQLATIILPTSPRRRVVQTVSYPYDEHSKEVIKVRMVPGEPATVTTVMVRDLRAEPKIQDWRYCHIAEVICPPGRAFLEDMLRYDCCELYDHEACALINQLVQTLIYTVSDCSTPRWTVGRWNSFSCEVKHLRTMDW